MRLTQPGSQLRLRFVLDCAACVSEHKFLTILPVSEGGPLSLEDEGELESLSEWRSPLDSPICLRNRSAHTRLLRTFTATLSPCCYSLKYKLVVRIF